MKQKPRILFVDEIHRFNKAQQDFLFVERGDITLVGATTENPSFEIIAPLLSRCRVFVLKEHTEKEMEKIVGRTKMKMPKDAKEWLVRMANGDARQAITVLEAADKLYGKITIETLKETVQSEHLRYDKKGEEHYNTISAFIKSMRAGHAICTLLFGAHGGVRRRSAIYFSPHGCFRFGRRRARGADCPRGRQCRFSCVRDHWLS